MKKQFSLLFLGSFLLGSFLPLTASALIFNLPEKGNDLVGEIQAVTTEPEDNFNTLGRQFDVGYCELIEANPDVNPEDLPPGTPLTIPTRFILPNVPHQGIVINLAELRLYYFPSGTNEVWTYPIGIGRQGWVTPLCETTIASKKEKPTWIVPKSIQADRAAQGVELPDRVPPGPDNPLGDYALRLEKLRTYLVHGTNDPAGVGRRSSAGCVRMFPEDIEALFKHVKVGTPVRIINDSYKIGWSNEKLYLEAHLPLQEQQAELENDLSPIAQAILTAVSGNKRMVDWAKVERIVTWQTGIPYCIAKKPESVQNELEVVEENEEVS